MINDTQAIKAIVEANAEDIYKDSAQPSLRVVGKSLAQCVSLFATPMGRTAEILEKNIHKYLDKLEGIPEEDLVQPNTRVLVPILERMRYTDDEIVADYYAQILATASTAEHASRVSVAFIEILNRLCADELKILEFINSKDNKMTLAGKDGATYSTSLQGVLPVLNVHIKNKDGGYIVALKNIAHVSSLNLNCPENWTMYLDNMIALGLLLKPAMIHAHDQNIYELLKKSPQIKPLEQVLTEGQVIDYAKARIEITELGKQLLQISAK